MAFSYITLQHCNEDDALELASESVRVVRPGGKIVLNFRGPAMSDPFVIPAGAVVRSLYRVPKVGDWLSRQRAVTRLQPHASHLPERAQRCIPAASQARPLPFIARTTHSRAPSRPLRLLARPEPIEAMAPLPDEPPLRFRWRRILHEVAHASGPERLAPEWWRDPDHDPDATTRDYYAVEDHEGGRFFACIGGMVVWRREEEFRAAFAETEAWIRDHPRPARAAVGEPEHRAGGHPRAQHPRHD